jgi:hypothetical protein
MTDREKFEAFEWLRKQPFGIDGNKHALVLCAEINRLKTENDELRTQISGQTCFIPPEFQKELDDCKMQIAMLRDAGEQVCEKLEHPTASVNAIDMWKLRDALSATAESSDQFIRDKQAEALEDALSALDGLPDGHDTYEAIYKMVRDKQADALLGAKRDLQAVQDNGDCLCATCFQYVDRNMTRMATDKRSGK